MYFFIISSYLKLQLYYDQKLFVKGYRFSRNEYFFLKNLAMKPASLPDSLTSICFHPVQKFMLYL